MRLLLDTNVLTWICNVKAPEAHRFTQRLIDAVERDPNEWYLGVPLVAAYETRRWLIWLARWEGLNPEVQPTKRLEVLERFLTLANYVEHVEADERLASELWVQSRVSRNQGEDNLALGADALIAATAQRLDATVLTTNIKDFVRYGYPAILPDALLQQLADRE